MEPNGDQGWNPRPAPAPPARNARPARDAYSWLPMVGWIFLTFNSVTAIYRSGDDPWMVAFVVGSYTNLLLLYWCLNLRELEKPPEQSPRRDRLKVAVWLLASSLTLMFSYKVASIMPVAMMAVVWILAALTTATGFYALILRQGDGAEIGIELV